MVVENVRGAIPWVGRSQWNFGSFHLWGDVPALMPIIPRRTVMKDGIAHRPDGATNFHRDLDNGKKNPGFRFDGSGRSMQSESVERHTKNDGSGWRDNGTLKSCNRMVPDGRKSVQGGTWFGDYQAQKDGVKCGGDWFNDAEPSISRMTSSKSPARKFASAMIAKIPLPLSRHIAAVYHPGAANV